MNQNLEPNTAQALTVEIGLVDPPLSVRLDSLLLGRTFTHVLTQGEIDRDVLPMTPDFAAVWPMIGIAPYDRINGAPCDSYFDEDQVDGVRLDESGEQYEAALRLEPGTLTAFSAGSLIGIRIADDGLHLGLATAPDEVARIMLNAAFLPEVSPAFAGAPFLDAVDNPEGPVPVGSVPLDEFLQLACVHHPDLFTSPSWPVAELLDDLDLDHDHGLIAPAGFDFDTEELVLTLAAELTRITETYELTNDQAIAVVAFTGKINELHEAVHEGEPDWSDGDVADDADPPFPDFDSVDLLPSLAALTEPMVAVAVSEENLSGDPHLGVVLGMILDTLLPVTPRRSLPGIHWLLGRCADVLCAFADAEADYQKALDLDPGFYPSLRELATLASLRGDAERCVSLLNRAGVPADDAELAMVSRYLGESRKDISRNGPCWCGSGRKYKKCHLGRSEFDLAARRDWLYHKLSQWTLNSYGRELVVELAESTVHPDDSSDKLSAAFESPLLTDVALFEGGLLEQFRASRAVILPADERELLEVWQAGKRALYSVESIDRTVKIDVGLTLKDLVTGALSELVGTAPGIKAGDLVCARPLAADDSLGAPGGLVSVPAGEKEMTLAMLALQDTGDEDPFRTVTVLTGNAPAAAH